MDIIFCEVMVMLTCAVAADDYETPCVGATVMS